MAHEKTLYHPLTKELMKRLVTQKKKNPGAYPGRYVYTQACLVGW